MSDILSIETTRGELLPILDMLAHGVSRRPATPLLAGVLVTPDGTVRTMDFETEVIGRLPGLVSGPESGLLVDFAALHAAVKVGGKAKAALQGRVTLTGTENGGMLVATQHGTATARSVGMAADYPAPMARDGEGFAFDIAALADAFMFAADAADKGGLLPVLSGVLLSSDGDGRMTATATDRYRLHRANFPTPAPAGTSVNIPAAHSKLLSGLAKSGAPATMQVDGYGEAVTVRVDGFTVTVRTLFGEYPKVGRLADGAEEVAEWAPVNLPALVAALKPYRSARNNGQLKAIFTPGVTPAPVQITVDGEAVAELPALLTEHPTDVGPVALFPPYLVQTARIGSTGVEIGFSQPNKPVVLRAPDRLAMIMPICLP